MELGSTLRSFASREGKIQEKRGFMKFKLAKLITTIDREENEDCRSGPEKFIDSGIGEREVNISQNFRSTESRRELAHGHSLWSHQGESLAWGASSIGIKI
jgi:hypothetical protein